MFFNFYSKLRVWEGVYRMRSQEPTVMYYQPKTRVASIPCSLDPRLEKPGLKEKPVIKNRKKTKASEIPKTQKSLKGENKINFRFEKKTGSGNWSRYSPVHGHCAHYFSLRTQVKFTRPLQKQKKRYA